MTYADRVRDLEALEVQGPRCLVHTASMEGCKECTKENHWRAHMTRLRLIHEPIPVCRRYPSMGTWAGTLVVDRDKWMRDGTWRTGSVYYTINR